MKNAVWFEIPASDLERAVAFYERIFAKTLKRESMGGIDMALFPHERPAAGGAVVKGRRLSSRAGTARAPSSMSPPTARSTPSCRESARPAARSRCRNLNCRASARIAHFIDTEGNRIGLHARLEPNDETTVEARRANHARTLGP